MKMNGSKRHPIVPFTLSTRFKDLILTLVIYHTTLLLILNHQNPLKNIQHKNALPLMNKTITCENVEIWLIFAQGQNTPL